MITALIAATAGVIGATCLYLAAPHQALLDRVPDLRFLRLAGAFGLIVALVLLLTLMGSATAVFTFTIGLMLLWTVAPIVMRWLIFRKENAG
jgi:hypothetical protein